MGRDGGDELVGTAMLGADPPVDVLALRGELTDAFRRLDEERAEDVLDQCFAAMPL